MCTRATQTNKKIREGIRARKKLLLNMLANGALFLYAYLRYARGVPKCSVSWNRTYSEHMRPVLSTVSVEQNGGGRQQFQFTCRRKIMALLKFSAE